jgi:hypothetical protein
MISFLHFFRGFSVLLLVVLLSACASGESPLVRSGFKADYIVVQKHDRVLSLWANGKIIKSYPILALGADPVGHKRQEGDERTPEEALVSIHKVPIYGLQMSVSCASVAQVPLCTFRYGSRKSAIFVTYLELSGWTLIATRMAPVAGAARKAPKPSEPT